MRGEGRTVLAWPSRGSVRREWEGDKEEEATEQQ